MPTINMSDSLYSAIINNDITSFQQHLHEIIDVNETVYDKTANKTYNPLSLCCEYNRLEMVQTLTDEPFSSQYKDNRTKHCFSYACIHNSLECVMHFIEKKIHIFQNPSKSLLNGLMFAVEKNHQEIVKYLVHEANEHIDLPGITPELFGSAIAGDAHDIMHYLLYSPELTENADLYVNNCYIFRDAMFNNHTKKLHHLIHTYNIEYTPIIQEYLKYRIHPLRSLMQDTFVARDLKKQLEETLPITTNNIKRNKI